MPANLCCVEPETVDAMLDALAHRINLAQESVEILQAVKACGIVGRVFNAGSVQKIESALPGYQVRYHIEAYSPLRWRSLIVYKEAQTRVYADDHRFSLSNKKEPRVTEERIREMIEKYRKDISSLSHLAASLPDTVSAYNSAVPYVRKMWDTIKNAEIYSGVKTYA